MEKKRRRLKPWVINTLILLMAVAGISLILYPSVSDWWNRRHASRVIAGYNEAVEGNDSAVNESMWQQAQQYNQKLYEESRENGGFSFILSDEEKEEYNSILDVSGTGIMGYISIPSLNIYLPVYHDTDEAALQEAVGHLAGSSLPIGGENTHSVITGHTGLPSAKLFTDIDQLKEGDTFQITVLDHVLTYEVDDIRTVLPDEAESLNIEEGKDLCTLVTCTPYGINTHRLLVTGHRIETPVVQEAAEVQSTSAFMQVLPWLAIAALAIAIILLLKLLKQTNEEKKR